MQSSDHIINYNISYCIVMIIIINISEERLHLKVLKDIYSDMFLNLSILFTADELAFYGNAELRYKTKKLYFRKYKNK